MRLPTTSLFPEELSIQWNRLSVSYSFFFAPGSGQPHEEINSHLTWLCSRPRFLAAVNLWFQPSNPQSVHACNADLLSRLAERSMVHVEHDSVRFGFADRESKHELTVLVLGRLPISTRPSFTIAASSCEGRWTGRQAREST
jgi:hypothetical protein